MRRLTTSEGATFEMDEIPEGATANLVNQEDVPPGIFPTQLVTRRSPLVKRHVSPLNAYIKWKC